MIRPDRMSKMFVVGPKATLPKIVEKLHELQVAHIVEHKKDEFDLCTPLASFEKVSSLLVQVRSALSHLKIPNEKVQEEKFLLSEVESKLPSIRQEIIEYIEQAKQVEDSIAQTESQKKIGFFGGTKT